MKTTEEEIAARKARSLEKFNMYRRREQDIKEGRKYFVEHGLPLLVAFPSDIDFGIYITFEPINESSLRVAFAIRSRKDIDSAKKVRGILGHRLKSNDPDTVILLKSDRINKGNFLSKDGGWSFVKLYEAFGFVVLDEVRHWKNCPKWLSRALRNQDTLAFMDHRLLRHFDDDWPFDAVDLAERYYERSWPRLPAPIRVLA
jgi:hypothetical protein